MAGASQKREKVTGYRLLRDAAHRVAEIYHYTADRWGEEQADRYYLGLLDKFDAIAARQVPWRTVPAEFGVRGNYCRYERHLIYWRILDDGRVGIVAVIHERMSQVQAVRAAFEELDAEP